MVSDTFINYTHPTDLADRTNRRRVSQFIGLHWRNRSKPSARRKIQNRKVHSIDSSQGAHDFVYLDLGEDDSLEDAPTTKSLLPRDGRGLRDDPFKMWPIQHHDSIAPALDYYFRYYVHTKAEHTASSRQSAGILSVADQLRIALQHPLMFETMIALSSANMTVSHWKNGQVDRVTLQHYGSAVRRLRNMISKNNVEDATSESTLLAISALMGIEYLSHDLMAFEAQIGGLRQLVQLRGGVGSFSSTSPVPRIIDAVETYWTYICCENLLPRWHVVTVSPLPVSNVVLPTVEATSELQEEIAALPPGFRRLAQKHSFAPEVVMLIKRFSQFDTAQSQTDMRMARPGTILPPMGPRGPAPNVRTENTCIGEHIAAVMVSGSLSDIEHVVCATLFAFTIAFVTLDGLFPAAQAQLNSSYDEVMRFSLNDDEDTLRDFFTWSAMMIGGTMFPPCAE